MCSGELGRGVVGQWGVGAGGWGAGGVGAGGWGQGGLGAAPGVFVNVMSAGENIGPIRIRVRQSSAYADHRGRCRSGYRSTGKGGVPQVRNLE